MKLGLTITWLLIVFLVACSSEVVENEKIENPKIINYAEPRFYQGDATLIDLGCQSSGVKGHWDCSSDSQLGSMGCDHIYTDEWIGGFTPPYWIWKCFNRESISNEYFTPSESCHDDWPMEYYSEAFVVANTKEVRFLNVLDTSDLTRTFAPIDSKEEALSYLILATYISDGSLGELWPAFRPDIDWNSIEYHLDMIEGTHVLESKDGYLINLFSGFDCGCDNHNVYTVNVLVAKDGKIYELDKRLIYTVEACVD